MARGGDRPLPIAHGGAALRRVEAGPFTVSEVVYDAHLHQARHSHERACLTFVMQGGFTEHIVGERTRCAPFSFLLKPAGLLHSCHEGRPGTRCLTLEVPEPSIASFGTVGSLWRRASYADGETLWPLMVRVSDELRSTDPAGSLALQGLCMDLVAELYRLTLLPRGEEEPPWLREAVEVLRASRGRHIGLAALSDRVGVHRTHLSREFRKHHGLSIGAFARQLRVRHACELLLLPDLSLAEIAADAGFYDQSHFTNVFHRQIGMTPGAYRQRLRDDRRSRETRDAS